MTTTPTPNPRGRDETASGVTDQEPADRKHDAATAMYEALKSLLDAADYVIHFDLSKREQIHAMSTARQQARAALRPVERAAPNSEPGSAPLRPKQHWDFVDEDGCLHCNCSIGVIEPGSAPTDELARLRADLEQCRREREELRKALDRDKTGLAQALALIVKAAKGRTWLVEGRGPYEYDDDDYRKEAGWALDEIIDIAEKALLASGTLATSTIHALDRRSVPPKGPENL